MRHVARTYLNLLHSCRSRHKDKKVIYMLIGLSEMHISFGKISKHLRVPLSFVNSHCLNSTLTKEKMCISNQIHCDKMDISLVSRLKQDDAETEDRGKQCSEEFEEQFPPYILESNTIEDYEDTLCYVENGLQKVYPYYFTYRIFVKERWVGQKLIDIFQKEFKTTSVEEYIWRFQSGEVTVNNEKVEMDYRVKIQDYIQNTIHRHETPIIYQPIPIIHLDKDILVINKPSSVPVHPSGSYRHNSILFILAKEYNLKNLRCVHRLDCPTSGLLIFGRTREIAQTLAYQIRNREVKKEYICRVAGEFPDKIIECTEPIEILDSKIAMGKVSTNGKPSVTVFQKLSYNGKTSVVLCKPTTGRMHQIRIHLQSLGYPILNDPLYNQCKVADTNGETNELVPLERHSGDKQNLPIVAEQTFMTENTFSQLRSCPAMSQLASKFDEHCCECRLPKADPDPSDLIIYLHAWKYEGKGWSYKTKLPNWAHENWDNE